MLTTTLARISGDSASGPPRCRKICWTSGSSCRWRSRSCWRMTRSSLSSYWHPSRRDIRSVWRALGKGPPSPCSPILDDGKILNADIVVLLSFHCIILRDSLLVSITLRDSVVVAINTLILRIVQCCYFFGRDFYLTKGNRD